MNIVHEPATPASTEFRNLNIGDVFRASAGGKTNIKCGSSIDVPNCIDLEYSRATTFNSDSRVFVAKDATLTVKWS
jgi:hypothetical protein